jgi:hypothetical protein
LPTDGRRRLQRIVRIPRRRIFRKGGLRHLGLQFVELLTALKLFLCALVIPLRPRGFGPLERQHRIVIVGFPLFTPLLALLLLKFERQLADVRDGLAPEFAFALRGPLLGYRL